MWTLDSPTLKAQLYSVVSVAEGEGLTFDVTAVQHEPGKFSAIDHGTRLDPRPVTVVPPRVQPAPTDVTISSYNVVRQGVSAQTAVIKWSAAESAVRYEVEWRRNDSDWVRAGRAGSTSFEIDDAYAGSYVARVRAINSIEVPSAWVQSPATQLDGLLSAPPAVSNLRASSQVMGIGLSWGFPDGPNIIQRTEIWHSQTNSRESATKLGDFAYPQNTHNMIGLASGARFFFWARLVDKNGLAGPWTPSGTGTPGAASSNSDEILGYLAGKISDTELSKQLLDKVESGGGSAVEVEAIKTALSAMYTIKTQLTVDGVPYMAGIGVGVENNNGVLTSQVLLSAQRVAVINEENGAATVPFVIQNGQTFINEAFIGRASIGSAQIADWLESDAVNTLGQKVWRLNMRTGEMQFNGLGGPDGRLTISNNVIRMYDNNDQLRVELGRVA